MIAGRSTRIVTPKGRSRATREHRHAPKITRRRFLTAVGAGTGLLAVAGCDALIGRVEESPGVARAPATGRLRERTLIAAPLEFAVAGRGAHTWGYEGDVPGPEIRATEGDTLRVTLSNRLPEDTTIHWHGLAVPTAMDGVPGLSQSPVKGGGGYVYEFVVPAAGTYLYHSHMGLQLDRGLYGPLIVEPQHEPLAYDREYNILLDDWLDGVAGTPEDALESLQEGSAGGMMDGGMMRGRDWEYPAYLINGRPPEDPETLTVRQGETVRLRLINAAAETLFRFAVAGHRLTVTHADGLAVEPVKVDCLRIGMGERYDVLVEATAPGAWQVAALPENKTGLGRAILRYEGNAETSPPPAYLRPRELDGQALSYPDLRSRQDKPYSSENPLRGPDRSYNLTLSGGMMGYEWTIDGQSYPDADPLILREGESVSVTLHNRSTMVHPMHLHGHTFLMRNGTGRGPLKDTLLIEPRGGTATFDFVADNPGEWFFHCHNAYHMETGMARVFSYAGREGRP